MTPVPPHQSAADLTRLNAKVEELERERLKLRTALIGTGRNLGAFLADDVSSDFLTLLPEEARLLKARLARAVEVIPLTWIVTDPERIFTRHPLFSYRVTHDGDEPEEWSLRRNEKLLGFYPTEPDASTAAQADYERLIRSALVLSEQENPHG